MITATLVSGIGDIDNDAFTIDGAILKTAEVFDYAMQSIYHIRVQTDDGQGATYQEPFTITVTEAPPSCDNPLSGITISGPISGETDMTLTFTAGPQPSDATTPITYTWSGDGLVSGQGTSQATYRWSSTGSKTVQVTARNCGGQDFSDSQTVTISELPPLEDAYEDDDTCTNASTIATDGTVQQHTFHDQGDVDWASFDAISGTTYIIQATSTSNDADLVLEVYDACGGSRDGFDDNAFGTDARVVFVAPAGGSYYVKTLNHNADAYGADVTYELLVRAQTPGGVVLIVAGNDDNFRLQDNILYAANKAYRTFRMGGIPKDHIRYLSAIDDDSRTDADGDGTSDVYASSASDNVAAALTNWAVNLTDSQTPFYLYMVDHGLVDVFKSYGDNDTITPGELDGWLTTLETTGTPVSVIYEACHSGSFIDGDASISKPGRVVIASTGRQNNAYPFPGRGAYFSDALFTALGQSQDLHTGFQWGAAAIKATPWWQTPWLDDNGNGVPNEDTDGVVARGRGLSNFAFAGERPPTIDQVSPPASIENGQGLIQAQVRDDGDMTQVNVWAMVYPPSFEEPDPLPDGTMPDLGLPPLEMSDTNSDGEFVGLYESFVEAGTYRVVVYAEDAEGNLSQPQTIEVQTGWAVYLPLILRQ